MCQGFPGGASGKETTCQYRRHKKQGFPGGSDGKVSACNEEDPGSIPGSGRSPGEGNGNPLQSSCLGNPMDRGAWRATVHGVTKSQTRPREGDSPRKAVVLARGPRASDGRATTVAENSQFPGLLILASLTRYTWGKLESKICLRPHPRAHALQEKPLISEAWAPQLESSPCSP